MQTLHSQVVLAVHDLIKDNKKELGIVDTYYGDEQHIPRTPSIVVIGQGKTTQLANTGVFVDNFHTVDLILFYSKLRAPGRVRLEALELAEEIEHLLNSNPTVGGVVHGYATQMTPGVATTMDRTIHKVVSITWVGKSRSKLGVRDDESYSQ